MSSRFSLGILDNAMDFLLSAAEHARTDSSRDWKYATLHLVAAVELLLKARLQEEHWSLLFADVDKATQASLRSGDFRSVDFETARGRLENITGIVLPLDDLRYLDQLRRLRNRVQHLAIDVEIGEVRSRLARGTSWFLEFLRTNLPSALSSHEAELEAIHAHLREFEEFVSTRIDAISDDLAKAGDTVECDRCWQQTVVLGLGDPHCPFCGFSMGLDEFREVLGEGSADGECLECGEEALAFVLANNEFGFDHCVACGAKQTTCLICRARYLGASDECPKCGGP